MKDIKSYKKRQLISTHANEAAVTLLVNGD